MLKPNPLRLYVEKGPLGRWSRLNEGVRVGPNSLSQMSSWEKEETPESSLRLHTSTQRKGHVSTQQARGHLPARKTALTTNTADRSGILHLKPPQPWEHKWLLFQIPRLWYFLKAVFAHCDTFQAGKVQLGGRIASFHTGTRGATRSVLSRQVWPKNSTSGHTANQHVTKTELSLNIQELGEALRELTLLEDQVQPNKKNAQSTAKDLHWAINPCRT